MLVFMHNVDDPVSIVMCAMIVTPFILLLLLRIASSSSFSSLLLPLVLFVLLLFSANVVNLEYRNDSLESFQKYLTLI